MGTLCKSLASSRWYYIATSIAIVWRLYYVLSAPSLAIGACSLLWLIFRLHRVLLQPIDDLVNILGIEVPSPPLISLLDLSEDTISIRWQASERFSHTKYSIWVNGVTIGDVSAQDTAISVTGLAAGVYYAIRLTACTHGKFLAESDPLRVRTPPLDPDDENDEGEARIARTTMPAIVPYKGQYEGLALPTPSPSFLREHSGSLSQPKRRVSVRKSSPNPSLGLWEASAVDGHTDEDVRSLTAKLDELRREGSELQAQDDDEGAQHQEEMQHLTVRREDLKREAKDKEDTSKDLRKSVAALERQNQTARERKAAQEKAFDAKQSEHRKMREDIERWDKESIAFQEDAISMQTQKSHLAEELDAELARVQGERGPALDTLRNLEEQVHDAGRCVRELEEARKASSEPSDSPRVAEGDMHVEDEVHARYERIRLLQDELRRRILEVQKGKQYQALLTGRLQAVASQQRSAHSTYDPNAAEFTPASHAVHSHSREQERRASLGGYGVTFPVSSATDARSPFATSLHPSLDPSGPAPNDFHDESLFRGLPAQADLDRLTGGALASPSANALLPSDLLGDDPDDPSRRHRYRQSGHETDSIGSRTSSTAPPPGFEYHQALRETSSQLPGLGALPGLGSLAAFHQPGPQSPTAADSRSPSMTSSPHDSLYHRPSDVPFDSDRRSVRSTSSSSRALGQPRPPRLLGDMFNRQRGRSTTEDSPSLGSLKPAESQSLPKQNGDGQDETPSSSGQRRAHSGILSSMLGRRPHGSSRLGGSHDDVNSSGDDLGRLRSGGFPWLNASFETGPGSRPTSVYSAENAFPRPSGDVQQPFGWNASGLGRSNTTASGRHRMHAWSLGNSRRGSTQVDPSGLSEIEPVDEDVLPLSDRPVQAPIGTKPAKTKKKEEPKDADLGKQLNPNASNFMTNMFSRDRKGDKRKTKSPNRPEAFDEATDDLGIRGTPQVREPSLQSLTGSMEDVRSTASPRASESGPSTPAETTPSTRESFMRKLTRKSSQLPGLKGRRTAGPSTPQTNVEDGDEPETTVSQLARTPSSLTSSPKVSHEKEKDREKESLAKRSSGFSLNSFKRRTKKEKDAPSISETSMTSGTGDEAMEAERGERLSTDD